MQCVPFQNGKDLSDPAPMSNELSDPIPTLPEMERCKTSPPISRFKRRMRIFWNLRLPIVNFFVFFSEQIPRKRESKAAGGHRLSFNCGQNLIPATMDLQCQNDKKVVDLSTS